MTAKLTQPPEPPENRLICDVCGDITTTKKHTNWGCKLALWLDKTFGGKRIQ